MLSTALTAAADRFIRVVQTTDVWSDDVTQAYEALTEAMGMRASPPTTTYAAARRLATQLAQILADHDAAVRRANLEMLEAIERASDDEEGRAR